MINAQAARPLIIAHRGASALAPENTIAAFRRAVEDGAEGIEFDVRLAKDGVPVVFHDAKLERVGGIDTEISDLTANELRKADVGSWFNRRFPLLADPRFEGETVPTLSELLDYLKDYSGRLYVELKCVDADAEPLTEAVAEVIGNSPKLGQMVVKSFKFSVLPHIRRLVPEVRTAALFAPKIMAMLRKEKHLVSLASEFGADELSLHYSLATRKLMKRAVERRFPVSIWTVNHPRWVRRAVSLDLLAIITNNPAGFIEKRNSGRNRER